VCLRLGGEGCSVRDLATRMDHIKRGEINMLVDMLIPAKDVATGRRSKNIMSLITTTIVER
jgi:hypothetical protein